MPLLHMLPGKDLDSGPEAPIGPLSRHIQQLLLIRLCEVCVAVLQWLEHAVASTQNPLHKPLRSPADLASGIPDASPLNKARPTKKVQAGRLKKVLPNRCHDRGRLRVVAPPIHT